MNVRRILICTALGLALGGCSGDGTVRRVLSAVQGDQIPDELPVRQNNPFRYPSRLYEQKVQGNVLLRLHIDSLGRVVPDSTTVIEPSGYEAFDSAAVRGSSELEFEPAKLRGAPVAVSILHPVYFRRQDAPPLPGDTILLQQQPPAPPPAGARP